MRTTTSYKTDIPRFINNSDTDSVAWGLEQVNDSLRYLTGKFYFNEATYTTDTVALQQFYSLPPHAKKLINVTVEIGGFLWVPNYCPNRRLWDQLNTQTALYQDYPEFFFPYYNEVGLFPTPASSGNTITMNYETRIVDLTMDDVTQATGPSTMSATNGDATLTASSATFLNWMVGQWVRIPFSTSNSTSGDNQWYQIDSVTDSTHCELVAPYSGNTITGASFTIGQVPLLTEDYQDLPLYRMGWIYYTTRLKDATRAAEYKKLYDTGFEMLNNEYGQKITSPVLIDDDTPLYNPNLFARNLTGN
jgi:hypothetical protein